MREFTIDKSVLVIDIGNTNIVCGLYRQSILAWTVRFCTTETKSVCEYYHELRPFFEEEDSSGVDCVVIGSVVPELTPIWHQLCRDYFGRESIQIDGYSPLGLSYLVSDPGFIGADLIANVFAAWKLFPGNNIVLDLGTATKIQLVTAGGLYAGVAIAPGLQISADTLFHKAAKLQNTKLETPIRVLGNTTIDALQCGIVRGHALMLNGFIEAIRTAYPDLAPLSVIVTGGLADLVIPLLPTPDFVVPNLTLDGLYLASRELNFS